MPPIFHPRLRQNIFHRLRRQAWLAVVVWGTVSLLLALLALVKTDQSMATWASLGALLTCTIAIDYHSALKHPAGIAERALFFYWLQKHPRTRYGLLFWSLLMLACGGAQAWLQTHMGGFDAAVESYGTVFEAVRQGELWRLLSGPFFHSGWTHYLNNAFMLCFVGPLAWSVLGVKNSTGLFLFGCASGPLVYLLNAESSFHAYLGVSAGIQAMMGALIAKGYRTKRVFPRGFGMLLIGMTLLTIIGAELLSARAATSAHILGLVAGLIWGYWMPRPNPKQVPLLLHDGAQSTA